MTKLHSSFPIFFIFLFCCLPIQAADPELSLKYTCEIPNGLGKDVSLGQKDGSTEIRDAHAAYRYSHSDGWHSLMRHYADSGESTPECIIAQTWPLMIWAHNIGGSEARTLILKAELVHGKEKLRAAVRRYLKEKEDNETELGVDPPATAPQLKSGGNEKPKPEAEVRPK